MSGEEAIKAEGRVVAVLSNRLFRVELANGHQFLAHSSGQVRLSFRRIEVGDTVTVEMSPYDLSTGRIVMVEGPKK